MIVASATNVVGGDFPYMFGWKETGAGHVKHLWGAAATP